MLPGVYRQRCNQDTTQDKSEVENICADAFATYRCTKPSFPKTAPGYCVVWVPCWSTVYGKMDGRYGIK
eukprot:m.96457 g.96457  ORF g.96457 m.96457 type:complete len:69 (-) comp14793_c1_seq1:1007-1213(-)